MLEEILEYSIKAMSARGMSIIEIANAEFTILHDAEYLRAVSMINGFGALAAGIIPIYVWIGLLVKMGAPYAEARDLVRSENFQSGFSHGFIAGLLKWEWQHVVSRFFKFSPGKANGFDESLSYESSNAYNAGLKAGFMTARAFKEDDRKALLTRIKKLSRGTKAGTWDKLSQISYVIELAAAAQNNNMFKSE